jgi:hypothetical protein
MFENVNKGSLANDYSIEILVSAMKDLASIMFSIVWFFFLLLFMYIFTKYRKSVLQTPHE